MEKFQIFGSSSSKDIDIMVFVDKIPYTQFLSEELCKKYNDYFQQIFNTTKEINTNLGILKNGILIYTYKGCYDECNNSLLRTYHLHSQPCPLMIERYIERDIDLKILRTGRVLLSFLSRTGFRNDVKLALKSDFNEKIRVLNIIDLSTITIDKFTKKIGFEDYLKVIAFQLGQTLALMDNIELYTKEEISETYPDLKTFLDRNIYSDLNILEKYKNLFLDKIKDYKLKSLVEY